ncbi:MAG TPA: hypothetical protein VI997_01670 [Candidatus Thermoplasmatota archaeon]|nr:hypothetical protein [Candidatus Thermoplasmatota archaeon]
MPPETPQSLVQARRDEQLRSHKGWCIACGTRNAETGGAADNGAIYRILRSGMHVGNLALSRDDHLCIHCRNHGKVK